MPMTSAPPVPVVSTLRPRYAGANIRAWIGFKQLIALAEEAMLGWFRHHGAGPQRLLHDFGATVDIVDGSVQLPSLLEIDDEVTAEASLIEPGRFAVRLRVERDGAPPRVVLNGRFRWRFTLAPDAAAALPAPIAAWQGDATVVARAASAAAPAPAPAPGGAGAADRADLPPQSTIAETAAPAKNDDAAAIDGDPERRLREAAPSAHYWRWRARYFQCHASDRLQFAAHVQALEEVVDRFLEARQLSIRTMLDDRGLIPVVSRVSVAALQPVRMEADLHTTFVVDDVLRETAFDGRMDSYVLQGDRLEPVATARILHGYAFARGPRAGQLATLDADVIRALTRPEAS